MRGFHALKQSLNDLNNSGPVAPEITVAIDHYQKQAEEIERSLLAEQAEERRRNATKGEILQRQ